MPDGDRDALWVPLLTHYRDAAPAGAVDVDPDRMAAQVLAIRPAVGQFLLAGSTGDGWEMDADAFMEVVRLSRRAEVFGGTRLLYGVLRATTQEVVERAVELEKALAEAAPAGTMAGLAVCPPIDRHAGQDTILRHYEAVLERTTSPVAVYQLPQVTQCTIERDTMLRLARHERVTMFKDTSGTDSIAKDGPIPGVLLVRGAEGRYTQSLAPDGPYDGWLLSTGNAFGPMLRRMLALRSAGEADRAGQLSSIMAAMVEALFEAAGGVGFGNPFSNANRAVDHLLALGDNWRSHPLPLTASGNRLPRELVQAAADIVSHLPGIRPAGYLAGA